MKLSQGDRAEPTGAVPSLRRFFVSRCFNNLQAIRGAAMNASACRSPAKVRRGCFTIAIDCRSDIATIATDCRSDIAARRSGSTRMVICFMFSSGTGFEPAAATRVFTYTWREAAGPRMIWIREGSNQWGRAISLIRPQGLPRKILIDLQICHLNNCPGDDRDDNLRFCAQLRDASPFGPVGAERNKYARLRFHFSRDRLS